MEFPETVLYPLFVALACFLFVAFLLLAVGLGLNLVALRRLPSDVPKARLRTALGLSMAGALGLLAVLLAVAIPFYLMDRAFRSDSHYQQVACIEAPMDKAYSFRITTTADGTERAFILSVEDGKEEVFDITRLEIMGRYVVGQGQFLNSTGLFWFDLASGGSRTFEAGKQHAFMASLAALGIPYPGNLITSRQQCQLLECRPCDSP